MNHPIPKAKRRQLLNYCTSYLYTIRNQKSVAVQQRSFDKLIELCRSLGLDESDVLSQAREHLKRTSIAAMMNGIV